ncbi:MAG TPA: hypothetical protein VMI54_11555 [Polyangiaceae bacterium]|nr:hypothetical protein [Polyangiaceae bacterium]
MLAEVKALRSTVECPGRSRALGQEAVSGLGQRRPSRDTARLALPGVPEAVRYDSSPEENARDGPQRAAEASDTP